MGIVKRWEEARCAAAVAECGTGKTLISLGSVFTHARGKRFTALTMAPPQLVEKWARECFLTLPGVRVFFIDGVRNGASSNGFTGVNEVKFRSGRIVREGLKTTLSELRLAKRHRSARARWNANVGAPSIFVISRERAKLGYFWRHAYGTPHSGPFHGSVVNPDTGKPILTSDDQLRRVDFRKVKHSELILPDSLKARLPFHSALWQADNRRSRVWRPWSSSGGISMGSSTTASPMKFTSSRAKRRKAMPGNDGVRLRPDGDSYRDLAGRLRRRCFQYPLPGRAQADARGRIRSRRGWCAAVRQRVRRTRKGYDH